MKFKFDKFYLYNPILEYLMWLKTKIEYQNKYKNLRIGYKAKISNVKFGEYNWIGNNVRMEKSSIDSYSYISDNSIISECKIGKFCSIGPNVNFGPGNHPTKIIVSTHPSIYSNKNHLLKNFSKINHYNYEKNILIGNDVWIGANTIILNGIKIGDGAIIGANSLVTKDVEPYTIVGGTPIKFIKFRFSEEEIKFLLEIKWWEKDIVWIEENINSFLDIKKFVKNNKKY